MIRYQRQRNRPVVRFLSLIIVFQVALFQCIPGFVLTLAAQEASAVDVENVSTGDAEGEEGIDYMPSSSPLPPGEATFAGRFGDDDFETYGGVLVPLFYGEDFGLLFINPRYSFNDNSEEEFNLGLGWRNIFEVNDYDFILGGNVFYDSRWTQYDNRFDQLGLGAEFLSEWVDARYNYYLPEGGEKLADSFETEEVRRSTSVSRSASTSRSTAFGPIIPAGNTITQTSTTTARTKTRTTRTTTTTTTRFLFEQFESALEGYDLEVGVLLPVVSEHVPTRVFLGYQDFDNPYGKDLDGFKGRIEIRLLPGLTLDGELFENDVLNGTDFFLGARAHFPLDLQNLANGRNPFEGTADRFKSSSEETDLAKRLTENVIRDPRILTEFEIRENEAERKVEVASSSSTSTSTSSQTGPTVVNELFKGIFVNNENTSGDEDGTYERPFDTVQEGVDATDASFNYYVYTFKGLGPYKENVVVERDHVTLLSEFKPIYGGGGTKFGGTGKRPVVDGSVESMKPVVVTLANQVNGAKMMNGPTFRITGQNVTVAGYEIIHSYNGHNNNGLLANNSNGDSDAVFGKYMVSRVGVLAENANNLVLRDNLIRDNSYGILLLTDVDGGPGGGVENYKTEFHDNIVKYNTDSGALLIGAGGSGSFTADIVGNNFDFNDGDGLRAFIGYNDDEDDCSSGDSKCEDPEEPYDTIALDLRDNTGINNGYGDNNEKRNDKGNGFNIHLLAETQIDAMLAQLTAEENYEDGINLEAEILMEDPEEVTLGAQALNGGSRSVIITGYDLMLNRNGGIGGEFNVDADGAEGGAAMVTLRRVTAEDNEDEGLFVEANTHNGGPATITGEDLDLNRNSNDGGYFYTKTDGGEGGAAMVTLRRVTAEDNEGYGLDAEAYTANGGAATITGEDLVLNSNRDGDGGYFEAETKGGEGGDVTVTLRRVTADDNGDAGLEVNAKTKAGGSATITGVALDLNSNGGKTDEGGYFEAETDGGKGGDATVTLRQITAGNNVDRGLEVYAKTKAGGAATITGEDLVLNRNDGEGGYFEAGTNGGEGGDATVTLRRVTAESNADWGLEVYASTQASGDGTITGEDLVLNSNSDDGGYFEVETKGDEGGDATVTLRRVTADFNEGSGLRVYAWTYNGGAATITGLDLFLRANKDGDGGYFDANARAGGDAAVTLRRVTAENNTDEGLEVIANAADGKATITGEDLTLIRRNKDFGIKIDATGSEDVTVNLTDATANNNDNDGVKIRATSGTANATVNLTTVTANENGDDGFWVKAVAPGGTATITTNNVSATGNVEDQFDFDPAASP